MEQEKWWESHVEGSGMAKLIKSIKETKWKPKAEPLPITETFALVELLFDDNYWSELYNVLE